VHIEEKQHSSSEKKENPPPLCVERPKDHEDMQDADDLVDDNSELEEWHGNCETLLNVPCDVIDEQLKIC